MAPDDVRRRLTLTVSDALGRGDSSLPPKSAHQVKLVVGQLATLVRRGDVSETSAEEALRDLLKRLRARGAAFPILKVDRARPTTGDPFILIPAPRVATKRRAPVRKAMKSQAPVRRQVKSAKPAPRDPGIAFGAPRGGGQPAAGEARAPSAPAAAQPSTRSAYPLLDCDAVVVAAREFPVRFGLAESQSPGVIGDAFNVPLGKVTIQIVATGFSVRSGESLRHTVDVTEANPYPEVTIHLTPDPQQARVVTRAIQAIYSVEAQTIGMAVRALSVVKDPALVETTEAPKTEPNQDMRVPTGLSAADVTVHLIRDRAVSGGIAWALETRFADIAIPAEAPKSDIGEDPQAFARRLMQGINTREGKPQLGKYLLGAAKKIAAKIPPLFWQVFREAAARVGGPPAILILTEEPYVPWELAYVDAPLVDAFAPPLLGAQAIVGRWPLRTAKLPPPEGVSVASVAVVSGIYDRPGWKRLVAAEQEAAALVTERFRGAASSVTALPDAIMGCLEGRPPADLLHFAIHGVYDPNGTNDGLVLTDGSFLDPLEVEGSTLERRPFVFLNACQVGQANAILGDYAGMAQSFVSAGASAVIAPLWSVKDTTAKDFALQFYAPAGETRPATALRAARASLGNAGITSGTHLAYQFYGHPALRLTLPPKP